MQPRTTDDVFDLIDGYVPSAALGAALELGLFWRLAEHPCETDDVAQAMGIPKNRCRYWLQVLCSIGLVEHTSEGYTPSSAAHTTILNTYSQETWAFLAGEARDRFPAVYNLVSHIRHPGSSWAVQGLTPPDYFALLAERPERARRFTRMLYELHIPLANTVAATLDMRGVQRLMDVGGGSGVLSLTLLRHYPDLSSVVVDIAPVCAAGREIAHEQSMEDRIHYHAANFHRDALPSGFDMVLACDVGVYREELFRKLHSVLQAQGRLIVIDQFAGTDGVAPSPSPYVYWALLNALNNPDYCLVMPEEVRTRLKNAGFQRISEHLLPQQEMQRWSNGWMVIEAYKE